MEPSDGDGLAEFVRGFSALASDDFDQATRLFEAGLAQPGVNPAVAGDVQKVLAEMPRPEAPAAAHVLVANYGRFGPH